MSEDICERKHGGEPFSVEAFDHTPRRVRTLQQLQVLKYIDANISATSQEAEAGIPVRRSTASARFSELKCLGFIHRIGSRPTVTGCNAGVYALTHDGLKALQSGYKNPQ
jgi:hypothetical protein